jgi:hypothetical protein
MNTTDNYVKKMEAVMQEYDAKAERLDAEQRLRHDDWRNDMSKKFEAMGDWTEATWNEFTAKAKQQWHDGVIRSNKDGDSKTNS